MAYLLLLTFFFLLLEISYFIQCATPYLADFNFVTDKISLPLTLLPGVFQFIGAQLLVHVGYCVIVWILMQLIGSFFEYFASKKIKLGIFIWTIGIITALIANQYFFPNSKFAELTGVLLTNQDTLTIAIYIFGGLSALIVLTAFFSLVDEILGHPFYYLGGIGLISLPFFLQNIPNESAPVAPPVQITQPNIFLIGIDSLRPDFVSYNGHSKQTPTIDAFLNKAVVFNEAITPLARTFPSWVSLLTGQYPRENGVRSNLIDQAKINYRQALPALLHQQGYETVYATDETRFSNIDEHAGFDRVLTPPIGLNDFLIGTFNDFPLSNFVVNTPIGKWLFPYSYANRPVYFTYQPNSFLKRLEPTLTAEQRKPLFMAVHFCLPHYPYLWASLAANENNGVERYEASVVRVDQQLGDFLAMLKQNHLLDHAIVVLFSDHGEALELYGDRITDEKLYVASGKQRKPPVFYPPSLDEEQFNQSAGHGTDVLGLPQYHSLLAFAVYGEQPIEHQDVKGIVSLLDIKPTLLAILKAPSPESSGQSLLPVILGQAKTVPLHQHHFIESDFSPRAIRTIYPDTRQVMLDGIELFDVDSATTRLTIKDSMNDMILHTKQYADIYDGWVLALYPQDQKHHVPVLVNLITGQWTNDLNTSFAKHSPAALMLSKLRAFYGTELST